MTGLALRERHALCETLQRVGPHAPTLCEGWRTQDLAAHLVLRERRPDAVAGILVPRLAGRTERVNTAYLEMAWPDLVDLVRSGPPAWSPLRYLSALDDTVNLAEFVVHHEDVLRAAPDWTPDQARPLSEPVQRALWNGLRLLGQALYRKAGVGVVLAAPLLGRKSVKGETSAGSVVLTAPPSELLLHAFGRGDKAQVDVFGPQSAVTRLAAAQLGF